MYTFPPLQWESLHWPEIKQTRILNTEWPSNNRTKMRKNLSPETGKTAPLIFKGPSRTASGSTSRQREGEFGCSKAWSCGLCRVETGPAAATKASGMLRAMPHCETLHSAAENCTELQQRKAARRTLQHSSVDGGGRKECRGAAPPAAGQHHLQPMPARRPL